MKVSNATTIKPSIDEKLVRDLLSLGRFTPFFHLGLIAIVFFLLRNIVAYDTLAYWLGSILVVSTGRMFIQTSRASRFFSPGIYFALFSWLAITQALVWAGGIVYLSGSIPLESEIFLIFIACGLAAGAVAVLYPSLILYSSYAISVMAPIIINLFIQGGAYATAIALASTVFLATMIFAAIGSNRNYRELRKTLATLNKQSSFIQDMYNAAQDISFITCEILNNDCRIISFSPGSEIMFGCKSQSVIGRSLKTIQKSESHEKWEKLISAVRENAKPAKAELDIIREDGETFTGFLSVYPLFGGNSKVPSILIVLSDITERRRAEEALRESQQMLQLVLDTIPVRVFWKDKNSVYQGCNQLFTSDSGLNSPEEVVGKSDHELAWKDRAEIYRAQDQHVIQTGKPLLNYEESITTPDRRELWLRTSMIPLRNLEGDIVGVLGTCEDITKRRRSDELVRQSEEKYRNLIETMHEGVVIADLEENIIFGNKAAGDIFGYARNELIAMNFKNIVVEEELEKIYRETQKRKNKKCSRYEATIRRKDGEIRQVFVSATPYLDDEEIVRGAVGVFTDISELKKAERDKQELKEKLIRAQRMESIGVLAGGVAHDLNNILGPLVGYPELIISQLPPESRVVKQISRIQKAAYRAAEVVQDLLTMARRGRYEMTPVDLNQVVDSYIQSTDFSNLKSRFPGVEIKVEIDQNIPRVYGSTSHLSKVVMNLIINAFDAMPYSGRLTIRTECKYVEKLTGGYDNIEKGKYVLLVIGDTGIGIDKDDYKRLFEPFYTKKKMGRSGSGLGLAIVYGVIKDHNGYIDVRSEINRGSDFIVYLPGAEISSTDEEKPIVDIRGSEKILVVDDVEEQRELAATILSSLGYHVEVAEDGRKAVKYLKDNSADVVVLDMIMKDDFDGLDTYREIIKLHPGQKAIIASGFSETDRVKEAEKLGVGRYVRKPYNMQILGKAIREVLANQHCHIKSHA